MLSIKQKQLDVITIDDTDSDEKIKIHIVRIAPGVDGGSPFVKIGIDAPPRFQVKRDGLRKDATSC